MKKKLFITGASGYLGQGIVKELKDKYDIQILLRTSSRKASRVKVVYGDVNKTSEWENKVGEVDVIIHMAGLTHTRNLKDYKKINTDGTINMVKFGTKHKVKQFIFISTRAIGISCGSYGESKNLAEKALVKSGIVYTILRVAEAYDNSFSSKEGLGNLYNLVRKYPVVPYIQDESITLAPIHRDDVIDCISKCINNPKTFVKTYTVAGPENLTLLEIVKRFARKRKIKRVFFPIPSGLLSIISIIPSNLLGLSASDQMKRLVCKKRPLSENLFKDTGFKPRRFLL